MIIHTKAAQIVQLLTFCLNFHIYISPWIFKQSVNFLRFQYWQVIKIVFGFRIMQKKKKCMYFNISKYSYLIYISVRVVLKTGLYRLNLINKSVSQATPLLERHILFKDILCCYLLVPKIDHHVSFLRGITLKCNKHKYT